MQLFISLNREDVLRNYLWSVDVENMENGSRELHIFPRAAEIFGQGTRDNPFTAKIMYIQNGCSYGPNFDYNAVSIFDVSELFDQSIIGCDAPDIGNYSDVRSDAVIEWKMEHDIHGDVDELSVSRLASLDRFVTEYVENAVEYDREVAKSAMLDKIVDENKDIEYIIMWNEE